MIRNALIPFALAGAIGLGLSTPANAVVLNYAFAFDTLADVGGDPPGGQTVTGTYSFDNVGYTGSGVENFFLTDFNMSFLDDLGTPIIFTEGDAVNPFAQFVDGLFTGVSYDGTAGGYNVIFTPGDPLFGGVDDQLFKYADGGFAHTGGAGSIDYPTNPITTTSVPEPAPMALALLAGVIGVVRLRRRRTPATTSEIHA